MKFPNPKIISKKLNNKRINASVDFLLKHRNSLANYKNIEDFVLRDEEFTTTTNVDPKILQGCEHNFLQVRNAILRELRIRNFYLGASVLDEVFFQILTNSNTNDPIKKTLEVIRDSGVLRPGFVLYPVHSFGVIGGGLISSFTPIEIDFFIPELGLIVTPQTNSYETNIKFIKRGMYYLNIKKKLKTDLIEHWIRSRPLKWLKRNPLLIVRMHNFPGEYYENQLFIVNKLRTAIVALMMLNSIQDFISSKEGFLFSSARTNNWETFDIKHYLVFYPKPHTKELTGDCVPMNFTQFTLSELSELPIEIDPKFWRYKTKLKAEIIQTVISIEKGFYQYSFGAKKENNKSRVYRKFFRSFEFFRRSFRRTDDIGEQIVNLAVAFEILLTDFYTPGTVNKILNRLSKLLKGVKGVRKLKKSVNDLFEMRGQYVHSGFVDKSQFSMEVARTAYVYTSIKLNLKMANLSYNTETPIKYMIEG